MRPVQRLRSLVGPVGLAVLIGLSQAVLAASAALSLTAPSSLAVGGDIDVRIVLTDAAGKALADEPVELHMDGEPVRRARTDAAGTVSLAVPTTRTGRHTLSAGFAGDGTYGPASDTAAVQVRAAVVTIQTVPAVAGIPFTIAGTHFESDADGVATILIGAPGTYTLSADVPDDMQIDDNTRVSFVRWDGSEFYPTRQITVAGDTSLQLGLSLKHPVKFHMVDLTGAAVPASRVTSLTVQASTGARFTFEDMGPHWLMANRIQRLRSGMIPTVLQYAVASVSVDGSNVVNRFQQRYEVQGDDDWEVSLLLYNAALRGHDAFFGTDVGSGVVLTYPDGRSVEHPFGTDGVARFESLARGNYHVRVTGAAGFAPTAPLALSRDQDTSIKVLSVLDMALLGGALLGLAIGLMVLGRGIPWLRRRRARRGAPTAPALTSGSDAASVVPAEASLAAEGRTDGQPSAPTSAVELRVHGDLGTQSAHGWHVREGRDQHRFSRSLGREGR